MTALYKQTAHLLVQDGIAAAFDPLSRLADPTLFGHPPGYPLLLSLIFRIFGDSNTAIQFTQLALDAALAVIVLLVAARLLPKGAAVVAGLLVALAPQFTYNSVMLLPDTLAVLPIVLAIYLLVRASEQSKISTPVLILVLAGVLVGVSCWMRANALLLAPFLVLAVPVLFPRRVWSRAACGILLGALVVIAPVTLRNWIIHRRFIPLSLGAGQTLIEGIGDYDPERRFGLPNTDVEIQHTEAEEAGRPDYRDSLFGRDGVERGRARVRRAWKVIEENPVWFAGVMMRRVFGMLRMERVRRIEAQPPFTHSLEEVANQSPVWTGAIEEWLTENRKSPQAETFPLVNNGSLRLVEDESKWGVQLISAPVEVNRYTDYVLQLPFLLEQGRMIVRIVDAENGEELAERIVDAPGKFDPVELREDRLQIPFASGSNSRVRFVFANGAGVQRPVAEIGRLDLYALGESRHGWTILPRIVVNFLQRFFITAFILPLAFGGVVLLLRRRAWRTLAALGVVPAYYLCVQSALHTEPRYVLALHIFLLIFAAVALHWLGGNMVGVWRESRRRGSEENAETIL